MEGRRRKPTLMKERRQKEKKTEKKTWRKEFRRKHQVIGFGKTV